MKVAIICEFDMLPIELEGPHGLPLEECEYKEILDFYMELWEYIMNLAAKAMETIAQMIKNLAEDLHGSLQ